MSPVTPDQVSSLRERFRQIPNLVPATVSSASRWTSATAASWPDGVGDRSCAGPRRSGTGRDRPVRRLHRVHPRNHHERLHSTRFAPTAIALIAPASSIEQHQTVHTKRRFALVRGLHDFFALDRPLRIDGGVPMTRPLQQRPGLLGRRRQIQGPRPCRKGAACLETTNCGSAIEHAPNHIIRNTR